MISISSKLNNTGTTIFTTMSALAAKTGAINLSQGFPDYECDPALIDMVSTAMRSGFNQYAPMAGHLALREQIAIKTEQLYGAVYHPDEEITITAGGTQAIFTAIAAAVRPNDEVIIFEPAYDCYAPAIKLMGGVVKSLELELPAYSIPWHLVKRLINARTRMIILNSPHNPTATILTHRDIEELTALIQDKDILIVSDEVYEHLVFDGHQHESMAKYPVLRERSFIIASFGKLLHATGWKVGYCLAPAALMKEFRKIHQYQVFSVNTPMQVGIANYIKNKESYIQLTSFFEEKRNYFRQGLKDTLFNLLPCQGTYFQSVTYEQISAQHDADFVLQLTQDCGVAAIPVSAFYTKPHNTGVIRFCFAKKRSTLDDAIERLQKVIAN